VLLFVDNRDSFSFNLVHAFAAMGIEVEVVRPSGSLASRVVAHPPTAILLGPGPGAPEQATDCLDLIAAFHGHLPLLGVCLGHQCIVHALGGRVGRAPAPRHGKTSTLEVAPGGLFDLSHQHMTVGRYHSLTAEPDSLPAELIVDATASDDGTVMAFHHATAPTFGLQFHPESILSPRGPELLRNFALRAGLIDR
jgi:anthranilate synthase component 2